MELGRPGAAREEGTLARASSITPPRASERAGGPDLEALPLLPARRAWWAAVLLGLSALAFGAFAFDGNLTREDAPVPQLALLSTPPATRPAIPPAMPGAAATGIAVAAGLGDDADTTLPSEDVAMAVSHLIDGRIAAAIVAAARATANDPTDGQAWLVLGAAHEERGSLGEARRCYTACVEQGLRGPREECAALLRR